ncbi:MAG: hypothetical protein HRT90_06565 [Candidatus Margulisbacteria bacterium]|nr:hypothetical protein [Candidatus Margulisiibacteriota bacterium]
MSRAYLSQNNQKLEDIKITNTHPTRNLIITHQIVTWYTSVTSEKITMIRYDSNPTAVWSSGGGEPSGTRLDITNATLNSLGTDMVDLTFNQDMVGKLISVYFVLSDGSIASGVFHPNEAPTHVFMNFEDMGEGEILEDQYESYGMTITGESSGRNPDAVIVFDSDATNTEDEDLEVGQGNIMILPEYITDSNQDGYVDRPDDSPRGGVITITFDREWSIRSFMFIDKDGGEPGTATAFDGDNNVIKMIYIPNMGDKSIQTLEMDVSGVRRFEIEYLDSGAVTNIDMIED